MPEPADDHNKRLGLERFCYRYLGFWILSCVVASVFVGWGAIVAWFSLLMAMNAFRDAVLGSQRRGHPRRRKHKSEEM